MGRIPEVRAARAFAPGHLTGFFVPELAARDPRARGSLGAGIVLDRGVVATARWREGARPGLRMRSCPAVPLPISREVARRLLAGRRGRLEVDLEHALPVGQGLGMSAAGALATGLAVAEVLGRPARRAWEAAHLAELFLGGGLGGVAALGGGGFERRTRAGLPPFGRVEHRPWHGPLALVRVGPPLPSPALLRDRRFLRKVRRTGEGALAAPGLGRDRAVFLQGAERFTDRLGLASPPIRAALDDLRSTRWAAAQAMFGEVVFVAPWSTPGPREEALPPRWRRRALWVRAGALGAGPLPPEAPVRRGTTSSP